MYGPNDGTLLSRLGGRNIFAAEVPFDGEADALALIEAQAAMPESYVGGFCQLTTILQDSITTRILRLTASDALVVTVQGAGGLVPALAALMAACASCTDSVTTIGPFLCFIEIDDPPDARPVTANTRSARNHIAPLARSLPMSGNVNLANIS